MADDDDKRLLNQLNNYREGERGGGVEVPIGRGRLNVTPDMSRRNMVDVEAGYEHPVGKRGGVAVEGFYRKYVGPGGEHAKPDYGVGIRGKMAFAAGGKVLNTKSWRK